jgi:8-oxo-dGTP diphosphatase
MTIGKFLGGIGALIWDNSSQQYLLLKRAAQRDFNAGAWECVTGRVDQGESFEDALHREIMEEINVKVNLDFIIGTTHFFRGDNNPENELLGVIYACTIIDAAPVVIDSEHAEMLWVSPEEALAFLPEEHWLHKVILRAEKMRKYLPDELRQDFRLRGFEF